MRRIIIAILTLLPSISVRAQDLPDNAAYNACIDSLRNVMSALVGEWNATIPPHIREAMRLEKEAEAHPDLKDSLLALAAKERKTGQDLMPALQERRDKNQADRNELEKRYALVFEDAFPYFRLRKQFSKDSLSVLLKKSSQEIWHSARGKALRKYIKNRQRVEGEPFCRFRCYDVNGKRFDWRLTKGKKVFLIHDGLWCMTHGQDNSALRKTLQYLSEAAPNCFRTILNGSS